MDTPTESNKALQCVVVTPEKAVVDETVDFVAVPMFDGELGVLPGRAPLIGRLGFGELRTVKGKDTRRYFIDGGFVQVRGNVVTVLTAKAMPAADINLAAAEEALATARKPATSAEAMATQAKAQQHARAQIRMAKHGADEAGHH
jgi:F-type H+-transporting ATPase subunit epsilon